jgi:myo-inositol-1(or 4)-monophosphatase
MAASSLMTMMLNAARKAGRRLARDLGEVEQLQVSRKGPGDFVTAADHRAEEILYDELSRARHGYGFLMEERGVVEGPDKSHVWIVDPLDGTMNFMHGNPHFCISIGLQRDGEIVAGLIYNPANGDIFTAERGKGAFLNDRRIRVGARSNLEQCVIVTGIPHRGRPGQESYLPSLSRIIPHVSGIRSSGSAALDLAWLAAGRYDGLWELKLKPWDLAAGVIMVREAGGFVTDLDGGPTMFESGNVLAGNEFVHRSLMKML